ncbi:YihY/virulence factor BrkB family protein [Pseudobutyrivibrio xylanivorans]|uniref:YihY/virulence factor BrkB family protein n=1 Tax=Pseudobutyrivibrio xylanivorans TaxID=185007 RepID=A0A5P6VUJ6_PSEXY|nr:YihY/virulence factor BrkB family protein [Pseudobutyrivibrio xylanivorans]QFJ55948.1 YihY/virulence factor BrkB family protein [Pseudobutyrivibrio xylanivorans]
MWTFLGYGKTYLDKCGRDNIGAYAAQTAYFMIMTAIPVMMLLVWIAGLIPSISQYLGKMIFEVFPQEFSPYVARVVRMVTKGSVGAISISALMAIWSSGKAFQNLMVGLNQVNKIEETRNWVARRLRAVFYTMILLLVIVVIMLMLVFTNKLQYYAQNYYGFLPYMVGIRPLFRGLFLFVFLVIVFTFLFAVLPNKHLSFMSQLPGGIICAASWYLFSLGLSIWVRIFNNFSMYGAFATMMIFMFWLYFCMYFMLMAAEANVFFAEAFGLAWEKWKAGFKERHFGRWTEK